MLKIVNIFIGHFCPSTLYASASAACELGSWSWEAGAGAAYYMQQLENIINKYLT